MRLDRRYSVALAFAGIAANAGLAAVLVAAEHELSPRFVERALALGVDFTHSHFGTSEKYMPENMAPGVAVFDYDGDGDLDLYFVQGAPIGPADDTASGRTETPPGTRNRLFRQDGDGRFTDVTEPSGAGDGGYGMGVSVGDYDGDGNPDLYVTNFGPNTLLRNRGDGTFEDVTAEAGVGWDAWSVGAGFFDAEGDGDLDLFVVNYVDFSFDNHKWCGNAQSGVRSYCHPDVYDGLPDVFYRNEGNGRFSEVSAEAGLLATPSDKGLGVAMSDFDGDGVTDVYVTNDSTMNYLYLGDGAGRFQESALFAGVGLNGNGAAEASMGIAVGDLDGDLAQEIFITHLDQETNTLYAPAGSGTWADRTRASGLATPSLPWVGFGTEFIDHDNDGDLDVFVANGHIIDNIELFDPARSHRQPLQLFDNDGAGRFREIEEAFDFPPIVGRGTAAGDLDRDGDLDLVIGQNGDRALVLENRVGQERPWLSLLFVDAGDGSALGNGGETTRGPSGSLGARAVITAGGSRQLREARPAPSYLSQGAAEISFGLGASTKVERLDLLWPNGACVRFEGLPAGKRLAVSVPVPPPYRSSDRRVYQ